MQSRHRKAFVGDQRRAIGRGCVASVGLCARYFRCAGRRWTLSRVGKLIEKISGKRYSESGVWRLLKGLNFSCLRPSGRAIKRDEQAIRHWKTKRWPTLKKLRQTRPNHRLHR